MLHFPILLRVLPLVAFLAGCATPPLEVPAQAETQVEPGAVSADELPGDEQIWGGVIAGVENRSEATVIEVVGYPLKRQEPQTREPSIGRFRLRIDGFADPVDYRVGRRVTGVGTVTGIEDGRVGDRDYAFPLLEARAVHLWPVTQRRGAPGDVRFGIGIGVGL